MNLLLRWLAVIFFSLISIIGISVIGVISYDSIFGFGKSEFAAPGILFSLLCIVIWIVSVIWFYKLLIPPKNDAKPDLTLESTSDIEINLQTNPGTVKVINKKGERKGGRGWLWTVFFIILFIILINFDTQPIGVIDPSENSLSSTILGLFVITLIIHLLWPRHKVEKVNYEQNTNTNIVVQDPEPNPINETLEKDYQEKLALYEKLRKQVAVYDEKLSFIELGVYDPHFDFDDSEQYKSEITKVREKQKSMVASKSCCKYPETITLDGSASKGKAMMNRQMRLTMRAFNNECEAAIANTRWNNVVAMEKRIFNSAKQINSANESLGLTITDEYISLKLEELYLTHEYREQLKVEKDERAERARQEREEKALLRAAEKAEKKEAEQLQALERARAEAAAGSATEEMLQRIAELEKELEEAHAETVRAKSLAEQTRSGYVYIISNIGAFGEDIVKIGLTRRLNPDDRVKELGDASVPFGFDTHAMIYSDEAPDLEAKLHNEFNDRRVNMSNLRKEFFRVSLDEVEEAVQRLAPKATFFKDREAQDWYETLARRNEHLENQEEEFPASLSD